MQTYYKFFYCCFFYLIMTGVAAQQTIPIKQVVLFGDSLSDNGNIYNLTKSTHRFLPFIPIIPDAPYHDGRFSNGYVWEDFLVNESFGFSLSDKKKLINYAYGGAWAEGILLSRQVIPPGLTMQVNSYLLRHYFSSKEETLFAILIGGNDYVKDRDDIDKATSKTVSSINHAIKKLVKSGAKNFFVVNLPDLGRVPRAYSQSREDSLQQASLLNNQKLSAALDKLDEAYVDKITIHRLDLQSLFAELIDTPESYGFTVTDRACIDSSLGNLNSLYASYADNDERLNQILDNEVLSLAYSNALHKSNGTDNQCNNPDEYVFWDDLHPTTKTHRILAERACLSLSTGPNAISVKSNGEERALNCQALALFSG